MTLAVIASSAVVTAQPAWARAGASAPPRVVRDLVSGRPVPQATVVVADYDRPFFGGIFSSAPPVACRSIAFVHSDDAGRLPGDLRGAVQFVLAPGVRGLASPLDAISTGDHYALVVQHPEVRSDATPEVFGPSYDTLEQASAAAQVFRASPQGRAYDVAFQASHAENGRMAYRTTRVPRPRMVESARAVQRYATQKRAEADLINAAWTLAGPGPSTEDEMDELEKAIVCCHDRPARGIERVGPLLDLLERAKADAGHPPLPDRAKIIRHWRQRERAGR